jgi:hypothetical protein
VQFDKLYAAEASDPNAWSGRAKGTSAFAKELEAGGHGAYAAGSGFASGLTAEQVICAIHIYLFLYLKIINDVSGRKRAGASPNSRLSTLRPARVPPSPRFLLLIHIVEFNSRKNNTIAGGSSWV